MLILGTREIPVGKDSKIQRGLFSRCCSRNLGAQFPSLLMALLSPGLLCVNGTIRIQGPAQQNGDPAHVELKEIPQVSPVQPSDGGELQSRAIMSWLQPSKPSRIAPTLSIPQPYRKYGRTNDPLSSQECRLHFLTSVMPSWAPRFPSSQEPYCMPRLLNGT